MVEENCIGCALKYTVWHTSFCGVPGFCIECSHPDGNPKIEIVWSKVHIGIWLFSLIYASAFGFYYAMLVINFNNPDIAVLFFNIQTLMDTVRNLVVMVISFYNSKHFENSLIITNSCLQRWKSAFQKPLLKRKDCQLNVAVHVVCCMWFLFIVYFCTTQINCSLPFSKMLAKMAKITVYGEVMLIVSFMVLLRVYRKLVANCQQFIMKNLDSRLGNQTAPAMMNYIVKLMKHYRLVYIMNHKMTQQFGKFYNPTLIIYFLLGTIVPINGTVAVIYGSDSDNYTIRELWEVPLQLCVALVVTTFVFQEYDSLVNMNNDFLTYLYKYPISKLQRQETLEIETTIEVINHKKLELSLGNVLTPGLHIIGAVSIFSKVTTGANKYFGTVLTYVLVVVQFVKDAKKNHEK